ncbi:hypothetical protein [Microbispora catharanthi]|uniref:GH16 domain-containing protein n=1 Tax=Microbispora catharanthi TaxID=1712871 RepID=A0A5N6BRK6_9ACTN|nr:hypothetical protein [Microbispora catharanthi]KAB8183033.1 hypothetical protein FH610_021050 [Microbispora catharanthi]
MTATRITWDRASAPRTRTRRSTTTRAPKGDFQAPSARGTWPAFWLTGVDQMEGSSGSPGPSASTYYRARNVYVGRSRA